MAKVSIPIGKGSFQNVDPFELSNGENAADLRNLLINDAGANVDRPALSEFASLGSFAVEGLAFWQGKLLAVTENDRRLWAIDANGVVTDVTDNPLEGTLRPVFADDGEYLAIAGGGAPQRWSGTGLAEDMPGSPENSSHLRYLDGYWLNFLLNDQEMRFAGPTAVDRETWSAGDFFSAEKHPGNLKSIFVSKTGSELFAFKLGSTQVFQNVGDPVVPFQPTFTIPRGTGAGYSIEEADSSLFWFDSVERRFVHLQGRNPVDIGTPYDRVVKDFSIVEDCWAARIDIGGFYLIAWTFPSEQRVLVYDYKRKEWSEWDGFRNSESRRMRMHAHCFSQSWNKHFVGDPLNGTIWELSFAAKQDGPDALRRLRRTGVIDHGTSNAKVNNFYDFHVKRGEAASGTTEPVMIVRFKDDDKPWSEPRVLSLGHSGASSAAIRIRRTGIYRKRQIEVLMTDPVSFALSKVDEDVEVLAS